MKIQTCLHSYRKNINQISTLGFCIASQSDKKSSSISKWPLQNPSPYGSIPSNIVGSSNESISELPQGTPLNKHGTQQLWLFSGFPSMFFHVMFFHFISMSFESLIMCYFSRCGVFHGFFQVFPPETSSGSHVTFNGFLPFFIPAVSCTRAFTSPSKFSNSERDPTPLFWGRCPRNCVWIFGWLLWILIWKLHPKNYN